MSNVCPTCGSQLPDPDLQEARDSHPAHYKITRGLCVSSSLPFMFIKTVHHAGRPVDLVVMPPFEDPSVAILFGEMHDPEFCDVPAATVRVSRIDDDPAGFEIRKPFGTSVDKHPFWPHITRDLFVDALASAREQGLLK